MSKGGLAVLLRANSIMFIQKHGIRRMYCGFKTTMSKTVRVCKAFKVPSAYGEYSRFILGSQQKVVSSRMCHYCYSSYFDTHMKGIMVQNKTIETTFAWQISWTHDESDFETRGLL